MRLLATLAPVLFAFPAWAQCQFSQIMFASEVITPPGYMYIYGIGVADIDKDGQLDVTVADAWYIKHDPDRKRSAGRLIALLNRGEKFEERHITGPVVGDATSAIIERHVFVDMDGDGDKDIVAELLLQDQILWFENPGSNGGLWKEHRLNVSVRQPVGIASDDTDGDGIPEIVVASRTGDGAVLLKRRGAVWEKQRLTPEGFGDTRMVAIADLDNNGEKRVVATSFSRDFVVSFSVSGGHQQMLTQAVKSPWYGGIHDVNGDGKADILLPAVELGWLENPTWSFHRMAPQCVERATWFEAQMADMDGDGQLDFVATIRPHGPEMTGMVVMGLKRGNRYELQKLIDNWGKVNQIIIADIDDDGKQDVVAATDEPINEVRLWRAPGHTVKQ